MRIACVQCNVVFNDPAANAQRAMSELLGLKAQGVDIAVFPEAFLTGYCVDTPDAAAAIGINRGSDPICKLNQLCQEQEILAVIGFAEEGQGRLYNSAVLLEPGTQPRFYSKSHLPELGLDKYVAPGHELPVFDTALGKIGLLICFDLRVPEAARVLALKGAELIVLPTNWPDGAQVSAEHVAIARAAESRIFFATCNRVGVENGFSFIGRSKIISPTGAVLASAGDGEEIIVADVDLAEARVKRTINIPGKYETDLFASRQPELYEILAKQKEPLP
jgi:5-aminopentanamidase